jgi:hypothetical protein
LKFLNTKTPPTDKKVNENTLEEKREEMGLEKLKEEKLRKEIEEINFRIEQQKSSLGLEKIKAHSGYLVILVPLILGLLTFYVEINKYLDQREKEQKFKISKEMIQLVNELNSGSEAIRRNAALELAFFGKPAVPILIENLDNVEHQNPVYDAIIKGLKSISANEKNSAYILTQLLQATAEVIDRPSAEQTSSHDLTIRFHRRALETILNNVKESEKEKTEREKLKTALKEFGSKENYITTLYPDDPDKKKSFINDINKVLDKLNN